MTHTEREKEREREREKRGIFELCCQLTHVRTRMSQVSITRFLKQQQEQQQQEQEEEQNCQSLEFQEERFNEEEGLEDTRVQSSSSLSSSSSSSSRRNMVCSVMDWGVYGRVCPWSVCVLNRLRMGTYRPVGRAGFSTRALLSPRGIRNVPRRQDMVHRGTWESVDVDGVGELFVAGDDAGAVVVSHVGSLLDMVPSWIDMGLGEDGCVTIDTALGIGLPSKIAAVQWNPANQNEIGVLQNKGRSVFVFDINRTRGDPSQTVKLMASGGESLVYFDRSSTLGQEYCLAVGCSDGTVAVCDCRAGTQPVSVLRSLSGGAITCIQTMDHGRLVLGGTDRDVVKIWDLRRVSGNALNFGAVTNKHPLLHTTHLMQELSMIPGLIDESGYIPICSPQSLHVDPEMYTRVAVHMSCGWTSVLDVARLGMTHIHAPPVGQHSPEHRQSAMELEHAINARMIGDSGRVVLPHEIMRLETNDSVRRRADRTGRMSGCWLQGSQFAVPSRSKNAVFIIDFGASSRTETRIGCTGDGSRTTTSAVSIDVPLEPTCLAHACHDTMLAFGRDGACTVLRA